MTPLQQQQKEAQEGLEAIMLAWSNDLKGDESCMPTIRTFVDSLVARTREQTLQEVEEGIPPPLKEPQHARIMKPDGHLEAKYTWNKHRQAVLAHLRTLREGITGNEKI